MFVLVLFVYGGKVIIMAIYDEDRGGYRIFVGDLGAKVGKIELEKEFNRFGPILDVWIAR